MAAFDQALAERAGLKLSVCSDPSHPFGGAEAFEMLEQFWHAGVLEQKGASTITQADLSNLFVLDRFGWCRTALQSGGTSRRPLGPRKEASDRLSPLGRANFALQERDEVIRIEGAQQHDRTPQSNVYVRRGLRLHPKGTKERHSHAVITRDLYNQCHHSKKA